MIIYNLEFRYRFGDKNMLFENECFNISQIYNVLYYQPKELYHKYPGNLLAYELTYYIKGSSVVNFNGKTIYMKPGDIIFLPKGIENNTYTVSANEEFSLYNIYFDTNDKLPNEAIQISSKNNDLKNCYEKIYRTWTGKHSGYYYKSMQWAYEIFGLVRRLQLTYMPNDKLKYLLKLDDYMTEHYCDMDFNYSKLIELSGLSYSYFKKLFIDKYGYPPVKYITRLKINRACELLKTQKFSVSEIANMCGFENIYYFSNVFKKQIGVSPKNYKI